MTRRRKGSMAFDQMSIDQLWQFMERELLRLETDMDLAMNQRSWLWRMDGIRRCGREIRARGIQLSLHAAVKQRAIEQGWRLDD